MTPCTVDLDPEVVAIEGWLAACRMDGGQATIPPHQAEEFLALCKVKGAHHGFRNVPKGGTYFSQTTLQDESGPLVFSIYTERPI